MKPSVLRAALMALSLALIGCQVSMPSGARPPVSSAAAHLVGRAEFPAADRQAQSELSEVVSGATVSLIDARSGNSVSTSLTDAGGGFVLNFAGLAPRAGDAFVLEAQKGLSVGGASNRPGTKAARIRTLLVWNEGWQSFTNATPNVGIVVSAATTALATLTSLKQQAGQSVPLEKLVNSISGSTFNDVGTGLAASDFSKVLGLVGSAIALDQDPLASIGYDSAADTYRLATGVPWIAGYSPAIPSTGSIVTIRGTNLDRLDGRNVFWFGTVPAATWSVSADRSTATMSVPAGAFCAPFTVQQPNGATQTISPFLLIKGTVGTLAGGGRADQSTRTNPTGDGQGASAAFRPVGLSALRDGAFIMTGDFSRVRRLTLEGAVSTLAGGDVTGFADAQGPSARFNGGCRAVLDPQGNIYVSEWFNNAIRKITPGGTVTTLAGAGPEGYYDGPAHMAQFKNPYGMCVLPSGDLLVADRGNHRIRRVGPTGVVTTFAGTGTAGDADGSLLTAQFRDPVDMLLDPSGDLYVTEYGGNRIRKISPAGVVSTYVGSPTAVPGAGDGTGTGASFYQPTGLCRDGSGELYVADSRNYAIRRIAPGGVVTTLTGGVQSFADGSLAAARFGYVYDVKLGPSGELYVTDLGNYRIRVVCP
ncbi:MAG TPA: hypothetical protein V6D00_01150 [Pantanalinema sp.]